MRSLLCFSGNKALFVLLVTSFFVLLLDLVGIALLFPFLNLFVQPEVLKESPAVSAFYNVVGFKSYSDLLYSIGLVLIVGYLFKLFIKTKFNGIRFRTFSGINYRLADFLYKGLLNAKYSLFTEQSVSEMINVVNAQTIHSVICLESFLKMLIEFAFLLVVFVIALYVNPLLTICSVLLFSLLGCVLYFALIKKIESFGVTHTKLNVLVYKFGYAVANSIKDIKIMRLEDNYFNKLSEIWEQYSSNDSRSKTLKGIPADLSETFVFTGIILVCLYVFMMSQDIKSMVPTIGVLAVTGMRVLPSFNRIVSSYHEYRFYKPALTLVNDLVEKVNVNKQSIRHCELPFQSSFEVKELNFNYCDKKILNSISFKVTKGSSIAFVGASGAGKSTLLDVLVGLREANTGVFSLDGVEFDPFCTDALRNYVGYVPQNVNLIDESVAYNISFEIDYDKDRMQRAISAACLDSFVDNLRDGLHTILGENGVRVSGGQRQRIGIARAVYRNPEILIFDEATSALDTVTERDLMQEINQLSGDKTLIIVAHRLSTVDKCDCIYLIENGRIVVNGTQEWLLAHSPEYRRLYYQQEQNL